MFLKTVGSAIHSDEASVFHVLFVCQLAKTVWLEDKYFAASQYPGAVFLTYHKLQLSEGT